jgi:hypothetical protein
MSTTHRFSVSTILPLSVIQISPALASVPMLGDVSASLLAQASTQAKAMGQAMADEKAALWASLDREGILEPLKVHHTSGGQYMLHDGRHRFEWAKARGLETVPVMQITEAQGMAIAEATVVGRRHWTKGQRAYLGLLLHPEVAQDKRGGDRSKTDSVGFAQQTDSVGLVLTTSMLAVRLGVSADTVEQAAELYRTFFAPGFKAGSPEAIQAAALKSKYELSIWAGAGLGAVLAGIAGGQSTAGQAKAATGFQHLDAPLASLTRLSKAFTGWDGEERAKALRLMTGRFRDDFTPEFRLALSEALSAAEDALPTA